MTYSIDFNQEQIESLEFNYARIQIDHNQVKIVQSIARELRELISIPSLAMKCIVSTSLKEWQLRNNQIISDLQNKPVKERILAFKEIFDIGKETLKKIVVGSIQKNELFLDIAFDKAFKMFLEHLNRSNHR